MSRWWYIPYFMAGAMLGSLAWVCLALLPAACFGWVDLSVKTRVLSDWQYEEKLCRRVGHGGYKDWECIPVRRRPR